MKPSPVSAALRVLFFPDFAAGSVQWVAQCLEYDIAAQGSTLDDAIYEFERVLHVRLIAEHVNGLSPFEGLAPAPQSFWKMFETATKLTPKFPRMTASDHGAIPTTRGTRKISEARIAA